jgi:hypothetical protein
MANAKIISIIDAHNKGQDEVNRALHTEVMQRADQANRRLDRGVAGAEEARPDSLYRDLQDIAEPPPQGPGIPGINDRLDWTVAHLQLLGEVVLALVEGHSTRPRE